jgi:hypothetical protein
VDDGEDGAVEAEATISRMQKEVGYGIGAVAF